jgi:hypothetical protein
VPSFFQNPDEAVLRRALDGVRRATGPFFVQARCSPDSRTSQALETNGFYFVETTLRPSLILIRSAALERFRKILDSAIVQPAGALRARARKNVK